MTTSKGFHDVTTPTDKLAVFIIHYLLQIEAFLLFYRQERRFRKRSVQFKLKQA